ncbi:MULTISPECIES: DEAD/DEAH box helicase [unclassified Colwellia]|jgi:superfamily II DNA or RNA helicase|uniref:DEAD/DEAH box helicase n=1 Tax=unclassified Colwellia TaxID=196834 RepID=UPI0015F47A2A|nr:MULTISPECIES: DEAD/DEAH box helicase [unclassified Colwellia]MBA6336125.1 DEAD/DEAH box helicase [Colwellia sp. BRX8-7]MBA6351959.1 DEAD/DEAH box helicase [Colwellia sp. BRX9-1]MBA6354973.1 DEAD/DEAH box helicase [Colwellia sp. BRX8-3]MBA6359860.1 DEAD/DEAH box helicase [Colwellia sp. BRX8-6]MBA6366875.1 DEAD/DEAH box helicase [Colwellia sp. BRX8-5]
MATNTFTPELLEKHFAKNEWKKGTRIFQANGIKTCALDGEIIRGVVYSERSRQSTYLTRLVLNIKNDGIASYCDCYIGRDCKHGAALAQCFIHEHFDQNSIATSEKVIDKWLSRFQAQPSRYQPNSQQKSLLYFLKPNSYNEDDYFTLGIKSARPKNSGGWSSSLGSEFSASSLINSAYANNDDVAVLTELIRTNQYGDNIKYFDLFERIIKTNRCFWQTSYDLNEAITLGDPIEAQWQWLALDNKLHTLKLVFMEPSTNILIIKAQPLCYYDEKNNCFGKINTNTQCNFEADLLNSPIFEEDKLPWVMNKLSMSLGDAVQRLPKPKTEYSQELTKPEVHLHFSTPREADPQSGFVKVNFSYQGNLVNPHNESVTVTPKNSSENDNETETDKKIKLYRDLTFEQAVIDKLTTLKFTVQPKAKRYTFTNEDYLNKDKTPKFSMLMQGRYLWHHFLHQEVQPLKNLGWHITFTDDFYYKALATDSVFDAEVIQTDDHDFFSLGLNLTIDGKKMPAFPILLGAIEQLPKSALVDREKEKLISPDSPIYVDLDNGDFVALRYQSVQPILKQFIELFMPNALNKNGTMELSRFQGHQTLSMLDDQGMIATGTSKLRSLADKLRDFQQVTTVPVPEGLNATLRTYQHQGLNWLQFLREYQLNGILADDMGLGKTIQTLAHLLIEKQQGRLTKPVLIVAPTSVIFNWANEIEKFTPQLSYRVLHGSKRQQHFDCFEGLENQVDIIITSYALITKDLALYSQQKFYYLVLDEAHYIKNTKTKLYQAFLTLKAQHKLCLTGTPMENHLGEFWAQFNFLLPGFLGGQRQFTKLFRTPIEKHGEQERKQLLNQRIKPFILRRTKDKIATELPPKTEIIQKLRIEGQQAELYESVRLAMDSRLKDIIADKGLKRSQIEVLDALLKLRQVCNHPKLLSLEGAKKVNQSAKLDYLMETLPEQIAEGRKILIFSQFTSMLALIEDELVAEGIDFVKLTGSTTNRQAVVDKFQEGEVPVFLISLRAGGVGLNLTAADTVIHFDPWWNPAVENQATDRAYRIGQDKPVFVYKYIIENSIEEKIQKIQQNKAELAKALLSEEVSDNKLSLTDDILGSLLAPLS